MSDQQKTIVSLNLVSETCDAALAAISGAGGAIPNLEADRTLSDFAVLHKDFISLLSLLHASTTKIALSLKPSSPTYSASLVPLKDTAAHISNLSHNVRLVHKGHGESLFKEIHSTAQNVITSIRSLAQTFLSIQSSGSTSSGEAGDEYMVRTGAVHDAIEQARGSNGLSSNNFMAAKKKWQQDHGPLADALKEVQEMSQPSGDDDFMDDGWDELGVEPTKTLSPVELERVHMATRIIKIATLLHKNVIKRLLSSTSKPVEWQTNQMVDQLTLSSPALLASSDDLISAMYSPQHVEDISEYLDSLHAIITELRSRVDTLLPRTSLEQALDSLNLTKQSIPDNQDAKKWFDLCFDQLEKSITQLSNAVANP